MFKARVDRRLGPGSVRIGSASSHLRWPETVVTRRAAPWASTRVSPKGEATTLRCGVVSQKRRHTANCQISDCIWNFHDELCSVATQCCSLALRLGRRRGLETEHWRFLPSSSPALLLHRRRWRFPMPPHPQHNGLDQCRAGEVAVAGRLQVDTAMLRQCGAHLHRMLHRVLRVVHTVVTPGHFVPPGPIVL